MPTLAQPKNKIMQAAGKAALATFAALLLSLLTITHTGCKKPTDNPPTGNNTPTPTPCDTCLPPITTQGAGTFGCKINGKPFIAKGRSMLPATQLNVDDINFYVSIAGTDFTKKDIYPSVSFSVKPLLDSGIIFFPNNIFDSWAQHSFGDKQFIAEDIIKGNIHFLRADYQRRIFSGTFEFDVYDIYNISNGDTIHITEGRFDLHH